MRLLSLFSCLLLLAHSGCAGGKKKTPKSATHVYEGNAPSIVFSDEQERAGGPVRSY